LSVTISPSLNKTVPLRRLSENSRLATRGNRLFPQGRSSGLIRIWHLVTLAAPFFWFYEVQSQSMRPTGSRCRSEAWNSPKLFPKLSRDRQPLNGLQTGLLSGLL
jgi:hypothetical protein